MLNGFRVLSQRAFFCGRSELKTLQADPIPGVRPSGLLPPPSGPLRSTPPLEGSSIEEYSSSVAPVSISLTTSVGASFSPFRNAGSPIARSTEWVVFLSLVSSRWLLRARRNRFPSAFLGLDPPTLRVDSTPLCRFPGMRSRDFHVEFRIKTLL